MSFSQTLQGEVAGSGVLVQVVTPPAVDTDFWNKAGLPVSNLPAGAVMKPQHLVEAALKGLSERDIVTLDDERKAAMVSNLLVVLCGERGAQPIVNTGTLYT